VTSASAIERWVAQFREFAANGASGAPAWLRELRDGAIGRFAELGFPSTRQEEWRFTSVQPITEAAFVLAPSLASRLPSPSELAPFLVAGPRAVFVNGRFIEALSSTAGLPPGARLGSLWQALQTNPDLVRAHLTRYARADAHGFAALNTAFIKDGGFVYVPAQTVVAEPLQLVFLTVAGGDQPVAHPRTLIVLEPEAEGQVVEMYASLDGGTYLTNAVTELVLGDGARAHHARVQRESERAYHIATNLSHQGRDSRLVSTTVALGAGLSRHHVSAVLDGTGAFLLLNGLSVLGGKQHVDHHTSIDHARPHGESHEFFNGVFDGESRGVFNGRIIVRPGAQRTDSKQTNNNLLLSTTARADSQPQLEIYADDVKCTHGSTVGPLDETALFYLRSRGIGPDEARGLLTYGFAAQILDQVEIAGVREGLDRIVRGRLGVAEWRRGAA